jgi:DNA-binding NtrC family response regulator
MTEPKGHVLLIEDDPVMGGSLVQRLRLEGFEVRWERTASDGLVALRNSKPDAVVSDIRLPDRSGEDLYMDALSLLGRTPIVFVTAFADLQQAVRLVQSGADDYLQKPFSTDKLVARLRHLIARARKLPAGEASGDPFALSQTMADLSRTLRRVADIDAPVLIVGETGVGKEIAARYIYEQSKRRGAPFVAVNCAAIPRDSLEGAMFGHEKGAVPGAATHHIGYLEETADGILFLDEVADLHPQLQGALLRALQERRFRRVGAAAELEFHGRVIATTNTNLRERIAIGRFRDDLYYRLAVVEITIPPLRARVAEIRPLAEHFLKDTCGRFRRGNMEFSTYAHNAMLRHEWPGNVRELRNRIERAVALGDGDVVTELNLFPDHVLLEARRDNPLAEARAVAERKEIEIALAQCGGRIGDAAKALGISRTTLWKRMKSLELSGVSGDDGEDD